MKYIIFGILIISLTGTLFPVHAGETTGQNEPRGKIVFSHYRGKGWQLWSTHTGGPAPVQLTDTLQDLHYPAWSQDGLKLAYADSEGRIWVMTPGGLSREIEFLPRRCTHPTWSPDGRKLAVACYTFQDRKEDCCCSLRSRSKCCRSCLAR